MQFNLPSNLKDAIVAYDSVRKVRARRAVSVSTSTKKKSTHPLGNPHDLIPTDIVPAASLADAITQINSSFAAERYQAFTKTHVVKENPFESVTEVYAVIFHFESMWLAFWMPPENRKDEYVYGFARAFKNVQKSRDMIPSHIRDRINENGEIVKYGKSEFFVERMLVTAAGMQSNRPKGSRWVRHSAPWDCLHGYQKSSAMRKAASRFEGTLGRRLGTWDRLKWYERIMCRNVLDAVEMEMSSTIYDKISLKFKDVYLSVELINYLIDCTVKEYKGFSVPYADQDLHSLDKIKSIINAPAVKKWLNSKCNEINSRFNDISCTDKSQIIQRWDKVWSLLDNIKSINYFWPSCPIDYYIDNLDLLSTFRVHCREDDRTREWISAHMGVASFFQILKKHSEDTNNITTLGRYRLTEWNDTLNMIASILNNPARTEPLKPPKRWRISEFHDYIQGEAWKLDNDNIDLPQDLFPVPIKVDEVNGSKWSFFQPINTHQLAQWGRAVRNCVGNATHYAEGVKSKKHFIVLCNLDNKPTFTIQLKVENGVMSVVQIVSTSNQRLDQAQSEAYALAFSKALQQRESQLSSGQDQS
jgi:hypothetical protein